MIIQCNACQARFRYDESRFEGKATKRIRCTKCGNVFAIENPALGGARPTSIAIPKALDTTTPVPATPRNTPAGRKAEDSTEQARYGVGRTAVDESLLKLPADKRLSLAIIAGSDAGKIFPIEKPRVIIGRTNADVPLNDSEVSRQHAAIEVTPERVVLVDLGSTNGTYVAEQRIDSEMLENQSEFEVGGTTLMLIVTDAM
jgi:predicted Zn finger-like uncharacterized protein